MNHVLDASAMLAYLRGETGALVVDAVLRNPADRCYAHAINLCEVYYDFLRSANAVTAQQVLFDLFADGVIERKDLSRHFWQRVGQHKARGGISLADCFCLSLAQELQADLLTSDHKEFDPLVSLGLCTVRFIR
jgi:PIN domain nuclease of toxin-antitoxin system